MNQSDAPKMQVHTGEVEISADQAWKNLNLLARCVNDVGFMQRHMLESKYGDVMATLQKSLAHDLIDHIDIKTGAIEESKMRLISEKIQKIDAMYVQLLNDLANGAMVAVQILPIDQLLVIEKTKGFEDCTPEQQKAARDAMGADFDPNKASLTCPHPDLAAIMAAAIRIYGQTESIAQQAVAIADIPPEFDDPNLRIAMAAIGPFLKGAVHRGTAKRNTVLALFAPVESMQAVFKTFGINFIADYERTPEQIYGKINEHHEGKIAFNMQTYDSVESTPAAAPHKATSHIVPGTGSLN